MLYGSTHYERNSYSALNKIRELKCEPEALQRGSDGDLFSPEEIRGIIANVKEASAKLGEQAPLEKLSLIRELRIKLEELTQAVLSKSEWDKRFRTGHKEDNVK